MAIKTIKSHPFVNTTITTPPSSSHFLHFFSFFSPDSSSKAQNFCSSQNLPLFFLFLLIILSFFSISKVSLTPISSHTSIHCSSSDSYTTFSPLLFTSLLSKTAVSPLPAHSGNNNISEDEKEFWKQPDGAGYRPCLEFSLDYRRASAKISKEKRRFLVVVVSGGLNQQRNEIIDAVVIARILDAALVVPVLQVNWIWEDESEFSEIFDAEHFKRTLQADVRVVSGLPSTHLLARQTVERKIPHDVTPQWFRTKFYRKLNEEGVLVLKGLDSKLSKNLPLDLQKLRCKVAFHALRFAAPIRELGNKLATRMWIEGPYIALHLRLERDVWVRTGCSTGLGPAVDRIIAEERNAQPEFLTGRLNMSYDQRRNAGLCPLNALEVARLLKALGAPRSARLYIAGGEALGGNEALQPLRNEFPDIVTKHTLAKVGELAPYVNKASALAAIDYILSLSSDVFMPSHGGNMGRAIQGHRAYIGHRKYIKPNKRMMLPFFENESISNTEFSKIMKRLHKYSLGRPQSRDNKRDRNVIAYPVPECMCNS